MRLSGKRRPEARRVVAVCTRHYARHGSRLVRSLRRTNPDVEIDIYCDDLAYFTSLDDLRGCKILHLPEIEALGVKRAKFAAYRDALSRGAFLYLDADIVVLSDLRELWGGALLRAAPDDLSACPFIVDKAHPWEGDPELRNERYINSGVMFIPVELRKLVDVMAQQSLDDRLWQALTIPGKLEDQHFLCAYLNRLGVPVDMVPGETYNWQGFYKDERLQVERSGDTLRNLESGGPLALVHFAGIRDIDDFLYTLPLPVSSLVAAAAGESRDGNEAPETAVLASFSPAFSEPLPDEQVGVLARLLLWELRELVATGLRKDYRLRPGYVLRRPDMESVIHSVPFRGTTWNELMCGGAYLEPGEYAFLRALIHEHDVGTVVETGAGETSVLFHRCGVAGVAVEHQEGPWLTRARAAGVRAEHVPFDWRTGRYDNVLGSRLADNRPDLLFIDGPPGGEARWAACQQLLEHLEPRFVLFHDAHRDGRVVYAYQQRYGGQLLRHHDSSRGLVLFRHGHSGVPIEDSPVPALDVDHAEVLVDLEEGLGVLAPQSECTCKVTLRNTGDVPVAPEPLVPLALSYHWFTADGELVTWDGERTEVRFPLSPGDAVESLARVRAPSRPGHYALEFGLLMEGSQWLASTPPGDSPRRVFVEVSEGPASVDE